MIHNYGKADLQESYLQYCYMWKHKRFGPIQVIRKIPETKNKWEKYNEQKNRFSNDKRAHCITNYA